MISLNHYPRLVATWGYNFPTDGLFSFFGLFHPTKNCQNPEKGKSGVPTQPPEKLESQDHYLK